MSFAADIVIVRQSSIVTLCVYGQLWGVVSDEERVSRQERTAAANEAKDTRRGVAEFLSLLSAGEH